MTNPALWLKFPDDAVLNAIPSAAGKAALEKIFANDAQSPWRAALALIGLSAPDIRMIRWHYDVPYFNGAAMVGAVSGGAVVPQKTADGGYVFAVRGGVWRMLRNQWRIARFRQRIDGLPDSLPLSLALGLVMQSHMLRLGPHAARIADYLAAPESAPVSLRPLVADLQALQMRRTAMSSVWHDILPPGAGDVAPENLPEFFWDDAVPAISVTAPAAAPPGNGPWKGTPVCPGAVTGLAVMMDRAVTAESLRALAAEYNAPLLLVFRAARPQSVEYFTSAHGLLFCEGGALSHACTVARSMNIPCITALGTGLWRRLENGERLWVAMDGLAGTLTPVETAPVTVPFPA